MAKQTICDTCGEVIDEGQAYYQANVQKVHMAGDTLTSDGTPTAMDFHVDHLPGEVGKTLEPEPAPEPEPTPAPTPEPTPEPSEAT